MASVPDQSNELSVFDDDDGSVSPDFLYHNYFERLTIQLEYFDCSVIWITQLHTSKHVEPL